MNTDTAVDQEITATPTRLLAPAARQSDQYHPELLVRLLSRISLIAQQAEAYLTLNDGVEVSASEMRDVFDVLIESADKALEVASAPRAST